MIHAADVREWRNCDVVDTEGHRIGVLEAVYVDTTTDEPSMVTVRTGLPTRRRLVFVPVEDAIVGPGYLKLGYARALVKQAPSIGTDDVLPAEQEEAIFRHYGLLYKAGAAGERQLARR
ncbi:PRC-barrel domain-containing protein [Streptomyces sp. NBC_01275]|uniref:PRC-barrel domain-containing protein n=1 Tax=Streptomyces sp. NBC_01275 TaxID=2903807 RepID=UPI002256E644|nr:PRC-barrel domain-containing protein [Streptomyces sp. NBC_01275]MCX4767975.1 PRC-barrel domain-containing protein [Streptomyces sp. NBC_01275]